MITEATHSETSPEDRRLDALFAAFDVRWLCRAEPLGVDRATRGGVRRISAGDPAWVIGQLLELYRDDKERMLGYARQRVGSRSQDAEDVVQDVLCKMCQNPPHLRDATKLRSYVYAAIRNQATTTGERSAAVEARQVDLDEADAGHVGVSPAFDDRVVFQMGLARALAKLSPRQRQIVELVDIQRLTNAEAADRLGIAPGAVRRHHFDARRRLRDDPDLSGLGPVA